MDLAWQIVLASLLFACCSSDSDSVLLENASKLVPVSFCFDPTLLIALSLVVCPRTLQLVVHAHLLQARASGWAGGLFSPTKGGSVVSSSRRTSTSATTASGSQLTRKKWTDKLYRGPKRDTGSPVAGPAGEHNVEVSASAMLQHGLHKHKLLATQQCWWSLLLDRQRKHLLLAVLLLSSVSTSCGFPCIRDTSAHTVLLTGTSWLASS